MNEANEVIKRIIAIFEDNRERIRDLIEMTTDDFYKRIYYGRFKQLNEDITLLQDMLEEGTFDSLAKWNRYTTERFGNIVFKKCPEFGKCTKGTCEDCSVFREALKYFKELEDDMEEGLLIRVKRGTDEVEEK